MSAFHLGKRFFFFFHTNKPKCWNSPCLYLCLTVLVFNNFRRLSISALYSEEATTCSLIGYLLLSGVSPCLDFFTPYIMGASVAEWAKALLSWRLRSPGFTPLWPRFGTGTGHGPYVWKFHQLLAIDWWFPPGTPVSNWVTSDHQWNWHFIIIVSLSWYDLGCCGGVKPQ